MIDLEQLEITAEELVEAIQNISASMATFATTRLKRKAIVYLIHHHSGVGIKTIELVLNNLEQMDSIWLKAKQEKEFAE